MLESDVDSALPNPKANSLINSLDNGRYKFIKSLSANVCVTKDTDGSIVVVKASDFNGPDGFPTYDDPWNEINIHSKLDHPNIVKFIRYHKERDLLFIVTQYLKGESLAKRFFLNPGRQEEVLSYLIQLCDAVSYIHDRGYIHRDITPENIIVDGSKAYIIDFGAARSCNDESPQLNGMTVIINAKLVFQHNWLHPPEMAKKVVPSSDIFYLGLAGLFMLTGYIMLEGFPYHYNNEFKIQHFLKDVFYHLPEWNSTVSYEFLEVLKKAASWDEEVRFINGCEMLAALNKVRKNMDKSTIKF